MSVPQRLILTISLALQLYLTSHSLCYPRKARVVALFFIMSCICVCSRCRLGMCIHPNTQEIIPGRLVSYKTRSSHEKKDRLLGQPPLMARATEDESSLSEQEESLSEDEDLPFPGFSSQSTPGQPSPLSYDG